MSRLRKIKILNKLLQSQKISCCFIQRNWANLTYNLYTKILLGFISPLLFRSEKHKSQLHVVLCICRCVCVWVYYEIKLFFVSNDVA